MAKRQACGRRVLSGGKTRLGFVNGGNGFASQSTHRVHFGLGAGEVMDQVEVRWPSGARQVFQVFAVAFFRGPFGPAERGAECPLVRERPRRPDVKDDRAADFQGEVGFEAARDVHEDAGLRFASARELEPGFPFRLVDPSQPAGERRASYGRRP